MKHHSKLLLVTLLLALIVMLCSSCTEAKNYEVFLEEEVVYRLKSIQDAYLSPYRVNREYEGTIEDALIAIRSYVEGEEYGSQKEASRALDFVFTYADSTYSGVKELLEMIETFDD